MIYFLKNPFNNIFSIYIKQYYNYVIYIWWCVKSVGRMFRTSTMGQQPEKERKIIEGD